jgi:hypothetical protein
MTYYSSVSQLPHSKLGIFSCVLAALAVATAAIMVFLIIDVYPEHGGGGDQEKLRKGLMLVGVAAVATTVLSIGGLIMGVVGCAQSNRRKDFSVVGIVINGLIAALFCFLIVLSITQR